MATEQRRLAAIMFTDIAGYSAMSESDESSALQLLERHRTMMRTIFTKFSGREINSMADGFLVEFASAVDAVRAAIAIQEEASGQAEKIRIGIHLGDVVVQGQDVLGEGVNVASRIEKIAEPGGVCISEDVARQVRNKLPITLVSIGKPSLKNLSEPIELFNVVIQSQSRVPRPADADQRHSIAVLPFSNLSTDPENEFFSDGLTEDVLTQLSKISALKVISRTSVMQYKGTTKNLRDIGQELGVATLLEGSVRKAGQRVRISAQLIDAKTDAHLWAQTYDRELSDIFQVQSDVAEQIASALHAQIKPSEEQSIKRQPTQNMAAFEANLQGRVHLARRTESQLRQAIAAFERAIAHDPNYALAHTGLADAYIAMSLFEYLPSQEAFPKAIEAAESALKIDPTLAEAHASLGLANFQYAWNWKKAEEELATAIKLNPNYAPAHHFFADYLKGMGRFDEALEQIQMAQTLDPLSLAIAAGVGHVLYLSRQYDRAIEAYRRALMLDPKAVLLRLWFGRPYLQKGLYEEAIQEIQQAVELSQQSTITLAVLGHAQASAGHRSEANTMLETLMARSEQEYVPSYWISFIYVGLGENHEALDWLEEAYKERSAWLAWVNVEPRFDPLRPERRFQELVAKIGFPSAV